jgi:hypothetical protein
MAKKSKSKHRFNDTVIKNGMIVKINKDGTIRSTVGPYTPNHKKVSK